MLLRLPSKMLHPPAEVAQQNAPEVAQQNAPEVATAHAPEVAQQNATPSCMNMSNLPPEYNRHICIYIYVCIVQQSILGLGQQLSLDKNKLSPSPPLKNITLRQSPT